MWLHPRQWPWWGWVIAAALFLLFLLSSLVLVIRIQGLASLTELEHELAARDAGMVPRDLLKRIPALDADRQERAWRLISSGVRNWSTVAKSAPWRLRSLYVTEQGRVAQRQDIQSILSSSDAARQQWRTLHQEGPVLLSTLGWLARDVPDLEYFSISRLSSLRIPALLGIRELANSFATEAASSPDPRTALADLDALVAAQYPTGTLLDAMIGLSISTTQDEAWLAATIRQRIDPEQWIVKKMYPSDLMAIGIAHERLLMAGMLTNMARQGRGWSEFSSLGAGTTTSWWERMLSPLGWAHSYAILPGEAVAQQRLLLKLEADTRSGVGKMAAKPPALPVIDMILHPLSRLMSANLQESVISALESDLRTKRYRLAAALASHWHQHGQLPADAIEQNFPHPELLAATSALPAQIYQRISPTHFRIAVSTVLPVGSWLDASLITVPPLSSAKPWTYKNEQYCLELDLAAEIVP